MGLLPTFGTGVGHVPNFQSQEMSAGTRSISEELQRQVYEGKVNRAFEQIGAPARPPRTGVIHTKGAIQGPSLVVPASGPYYPGAVRAVGNRQAAYNHENSRQNYANNTRNGYNYENRQESYKYENNGHENYNYEPKRPERYNYDNVPHRPAYPQPRSPVSPTGPLQPYTNMAFQGSAETMDDPYVEMNASLPYENVLVGNESGSGNYEGNYRNTMVQRTPVGRPANLAPLYRQQTPHFHAPISPAADV